MCLAMPAQIVKILENQQAIVNLGGVTKQISIALIEDINEGDYVIIHVGYALTKLDEREAQKTLKLFSDMFFLLPQAGEGKKR